MGKVRHMEHGLRRDLPETYGILQAANLTVHPSVARVTLHGSRCTPDGYRPDSDVDLALIVDVGERSGVDEVEDYLKSVLQVTLDCWRGPVAPDLAGVWDKKACGLVCLDVQEFDPALCHETAPGCMGVVKVQSGYAGVVPDEHVDVREMYPCRTVWRRAQAAGSLPLPSE
jgi:hypothetical protein